jgi:polysaccharide export outer membrane protein
MAKDLTVYGKRKNILIIREVDGVKTFNRVDTNNATFMNSPFLLFGTKCGVCRAQPK